MRLRRSHKVVLNWFSNETATEFLECVHLIRKDKFSNTKRGRNPSIPFSTLVSYNTILFVFVSYQKKKISTSFTNSITSSRAKWSATGAGVVRPGRPTCGHTGRRPELPRCQTSCSRDGSACRCTAEADPRSNRTRPVECCSWSARRFPGARFGKPGRSRFWKIILLFNKLQTHIWRLRLYSSNQ